MSDLLSMGVDFANNIVGNLVNYVRDDNAREWQEYMWERQNDYNKPIHQRQRLEEAGINPNLAFGSSASSGLASNPPSTPSTHDVKLNLGEFYLRKKQVESQIRAQEANTRREDELTRQMEMNNQILEQLMADKINTERYDMFVHRILLGWQDDNLRHSLDVGLQTDEQKLDVLRAVEALDRARKDHTDSSKRVLEEQLSYLKSKYGFEKGYFDKNLNPYETSTNMGAIRYVFGVIENILDNWSDWLNKW